MAFGHEQLDVYRAAIEDVGWAYRFGAALAGHRNAQDQFLRASQAIPLNIAEGNAKRDGRIGSTPIPIPTPTPMGTQNGDLANGEGAGDSQWLAPRADTCQSFGPEGNDRSALLAERAPRD